MRILTRAEFLALPEETVFAKYSTFGNFGEIEIKGETAGENIDYWYQPLAQAIDSENSNEWADTVTAAEKGAPFKLDLDCMSRDGMFDQQQRFVVWDQDDVKQLVERLQRCVSATAEVEAARPIVDEMLAPLRFAMAKPATVAGQFICPSCCRTVETTTFPIGAVVHCPYCHRANCVVVTR